MAKKFKKWSEIKNRDWSPEVVQELDERVEKELHELRLKELRELVGATQEETARAAQWSQSEISKVERRQDMKISSLRRYAAALGVEIEIIARFEGRTVRIG